MGGALQASDVVDVGRWLLTPVGGTHVNPGRRRAGSPLRIAPLDVWSEW